MLQGPCSGLQLRLLRWRAASAQSPCRRRAATRTNSSISASATSSSSSPSSWAVARARRAMSASASSPSADSRGSPPAASPKAPMKPRHQSNSAPLRAASEASSPGPSRTRPKSRSSNWARVAACSLASTDPSAGAGRLSSTIICASQLPDGSPPPASQPQRPPWSSAAGVASSASRQAFSTSDREGNDPDMGVQTGCGGPAQCTAADGLLPAGAHAYTAATAWGGVKDSRVPVTAETGFAIALGLALLLAAACLVAALRARGARMAVARLQERELGFRMALWASGQRYWDFHVPTARLRYLVARHDGGRSYDFSSEQADPAAVIHPEDLPAVVDAMHRHVAGETPEFQSEHRVRADSPASTRGDWVWIRARGRAVEFHSDGTILRLAGTSLDIGRSRAVERENRIASEVLRSMNEAVAVLDAQFNFLSVNPAFARITGHDAADVAGRGAGALDSMEHDPSSGRAMREALARDGRWSGEMWQRHRNGDEFLCAVEAATVLGSSEADGERMYVLMLSDITLHKRAEDELRYLDNFDP